MVDSKCEKWGCSEEEVKKLYEFCIQLCLVGAFMAKSTLGFESRWKRWLLLRLWFLLLQHRTSYSLISMLLLVLLPFFVIFRDLLLFFYFQFSTHFSNYILGGGLDPHVPAIVNRELKVDAKNNPENTSRLGILWTIFPKSLSKWL